MSESPVCFSNIGLIQKVRAFQIRGGISQSRSVSVSVFFDLKLLFDTSDILELILAFEQL